MTKKIVAWLLIFTLAISMLIYVCAEEGESGDVFINAILTGQPSGDGTIVYDPNDTAAIYSQLIISESSDFTPVIGEHGSFKSGKRTVPIKINNVDNGATTPIVWLGGTDNTMDNDRSIMQSSIFSNNNVIYICSKFDGVRLDSYDCTFTKKDMATYASSAADKIIATYPDADSYVLVSYSLGGYATNSVQDALKQSGKKVIGVALMDSRDNGGYGNSTAEKDNTPMLILGSSDGRPINDRTINYAKSLPSLASSITEVLLKPFFKKLDTNHGGLEFLDDSLQTLHDFYDIVTTNDSSKPTASGASNTDLKKTQSGLLTKLNSNSNKVTASVKNTTTKIVSGALSSLANKINSGIKAPASTIVAAKVNTTDKVWNNVSNKISLSVTNLKNTLNKVLAA